LFSYLGPNNAISANNIDTIPEIPKNPARNLHVAKEPSDLIRAFLSTSISAFNSVLSALYFFNTSAIDVSYFSVNVFTEASWR